MPHPVTISIDAMGGDHAPGEIIAPSVGNNASEDHYHNNYQDPEAFLSAGGRRGRQYVPLTDGTYFINRWFAAMFEVSDYIFADELENPSIAKGNDAKGKPKAQDSSTWYADSTSFTNNVQAQVGFSVFLSFSWEYRLPK